MKTEARHRLEEGLSLLGISLDTVDPLSDYLTELLSWNTRMNLVGPIDEADAVARHLLDSLAAVPVLRNRLQDPIELADLGSGGGLPGIPLAIVFPNVCATLIERSEKKCRFLSHAVDLLGLSNASVVPRDIRELRSRYDLIALRAVSALNPSFLELLYSHLTPGGAVALYKGRRQAVEAELESVVRVVGSRHLAVETHQLEVPFLDAERRLVLMTRPR